MSIHSSILYDFRMFLHATMVDSSIMDVAYVGLDILDLRKI
uniref:Uncharacterized protein n=1 Tax=Heterorhabditis bacteriophora TaxID=37862 RepID=A0A1I7XBZ1_HETBA